MTTDDDILAALDGQPRGRSKVLAEATVNALGGNGSDRQRAYDDAIVEALTSASSSPGEAVAIWAAREEAASAIKTLSEAIMRADASKGIYLAEYEAKAIAEEAYAEAAKRTTSEASRQNSVAQVTAKLTEIIRRSKLRATESRRPSSRVTVNESMRLSESPKPNQAGSMSLKIIDAGKGSSGIYPAATLLKAAKDRVFARGLHLYMNHPTQTEDYDRPERSVHDLAGVLASDAVYRDGGLYAEATIYPKYKDHLTAMADDIGVSIRASAEKEQDGTISEIYQAQSVDFVTRAGRGGAIVSIN